VLAWTTNGSIDAGDWLPYALIVFVVLAAALLAGLAVVPARLPLIASALLVGFGLWTAISIAWSPLPSLARDDALLVLLYAGAFLVPSLTLRSQTERLLAATFAVLALGLLAFVTAVETATASTAADTFTEGRLDFPVSYWNGAAALFLLGTWPAVALAADRRLGPVFRALAMGSAMATVTAWLMTQSKGGAFALAVSGIVFLAIARDRVRALVPVLLVGGFAAVGADALTQPYRASGVGELTAVHHAGKAAIVLVAIALGCGLVYAVADRYLAVPRTLASRIARVLAVALALGVLGGVTGFFVTVNHPIAFVEKRWASFKHLPAHDTASSHFTSLGSSRYDYWRVGLLEFERNPLFGMGGHGWPAAYLQYGKTTEDPEYAHSIEIDALSQTGIVGFLLLVGAGAAGLAAVSRRRGAPLLSAGLFAAGAYLAVHTAIDWVWSIPSVGLAGLVLAGIGASRGSPAVLRARHALAAGLAVAAVAVIGFVPPWLSSQLTNQAYDQPASDRSNTFSLAERLDPLSVDPLLAQAALARSPDDIPPLRRAVSIQPADSEVHYLLGLAYLDAHRREAALHELDVARRLSPNDPGIQDALRRADSARVVLGHASPRS
jgi:O-antigen ligase